VGPPSTPTTSPESCAIGCDGTIPAVIFDAVLIVFCVGSALGLLFLVLLHSGRGGGLSDMFGGGSLGGSSAGSTVVERNLDRLTVVTAVIFMFSTVILALSLQPA